MGWEHTVREKKLAPIGEYKPERYRVVVHDTFQQHRLETAASILCGKADLAAFFLFCAEYVIANHRRLKGFRRIFRKGIREIRAAVAEPIEPGFREPESEQERRREEAVSRFRKWADPALYEEITGEKRPW